MYNGQCVRRKIIFYNHKFKHDASVNNGLDYVMADVPIKLFFLVIIKISNIATKKNHSFVLILLENSKYTVLYYALGIIIIIIV